MPTLNSSCIRRVEYADGTLSITFRSGSTYRLRRVPERLYHGLVNASSPGRYFNKKLKGRF